MCDKWWTYSSPNLSPTVAREYRRLIDRRVVPAFGAVKVVDLRAHQLDAWYGELLASGAVNGRPLSANSVRHIHSVLHRALRAGHRLGLDRLQPRSPGQSRHRHRPCIHLPSADEVVRLIEAARSVNRRLPIFLRLAAVTGARIADIFSHEPAGGDAVATGLHHMPRAPRLAGAWHREDRLHDLPATSLPPPCAPTLATLRLPMSTPWRDGHLPSTTRTSAHFTQPADQRASDTLADSLNVRGGVEGLGRRQVSAGDLLPRAERAAASSAGAGVGADGAGRLVR
ncbi:MAG: hypothetical protein IPL07_22270 [Acidimicrobiaceae bacterium]|nr:hypothetical protein [Acidimicrobiaceae bacterium]